MFPSALHTRLEGLGERRKSPRGVRAVFFAFLSQKKPHEALLYRASVSTSKFCVASAANPRRDRHRCIVIISPVKTPP